MYIDIHIHIYIYIYTYHIYICVYHHLEVDRIWDSQADIYIYVCPDLLKFSYSTVSTQG